MYRKTWKERVTDIIMIALMIVLGLGLGWLIAGAYDNDPRCMVMHCVVVK